MRTHVVRRGFLGIVYGLADGRIRHVTMRAHRKEFLKVLTQDDEGLKCCADTRALAADVPMAEKGQTIQELQAWLDATLAQERA
jgi:hypothetical protein